MTRRRRIGAVAAVVLFFATIAAAVAGYGSVSRAISVNGEAIEEATGLELGGGKTYTLYNHLAQGDGDKRTNHNFGGRNADGENLYEEAVAAVGDDPDAILDYFFDDEGKGVLTNRLDPHNQSDRTGWDPSLLAAIADIVGMKVDKDLLPDEAAIEVDEMRINTAASHFALGANGKDEAEGYNYAYGVSDELLAALRNCNRRLENIDGAYKSSMHMLPHTWANGALPKVVCLPTQNSNGHAIVFTFPNGEELWLRIECGFQPIKLEGLYHIPDVPEEDNELPPPPYLEEKDASKGPQTVNAGNDTQYEGGANEQSNTAGTATSTELEKTGVDEYGSPGRPSGDDNDGGGNDGGGDGGNDGGGNGGNKDNAGKKNDYDKGYTNHTVSPESKNNSDVIDQAQENAENGVQGTYVDNSGETKTVDNERVGDGQSHDIQKDADSGTIAPEQGAGEVNDRVEAYEPAESAETAENN